MPSSSSDSDTGGRVKNVRYLYVSNNQISAGSTRTYSYKRKLGDLVFNANFETGNLASAEQIDEYEFDLTIRPDVANPRHRLWFNFTVSNQSPGQCVIFNLVNISEIVDLFNHGLTPVVRCKSSPNWRRLRKDQVFYYRSKGHDGRRVLSIAFRFITHDDEHQFALFYPYGPSSILNYLNRLNVEAERSKLMISGTEFIQTGGRSLDLYKLFRIEQLGSSILFRPIHLMRISPVERSESSNTTTVFIIGRLHGNLDSVSSYVCQGLIDFALSDEPVARAARELMHLVVVPMLDPDSVIAGNSRTDIFGQAEMSRKLVQSNSNIYSNICRLLDLVEESAKRQRTIFIELQTNIKLIGLRTVSILYNDQVRMEKHLQLPRLFARFINSFYLEKCVFFDRGNRLSIPIEDLRSYKNFDWYGLEISPFAAYSRSLRCCSYEELTQLDYLLIGKGIVYSLVELMCMKKNYLVSPNVVSELEKFRPKPENADELILARNSESTVKLGRSRRMK